MIMATFSNAIIIILFPDKIPITKPAKNVKTIAIHIATIAADIGVNAGKKIGKIKGKIIGIPPRKK